MLFFNFEMREKKRVLSILVIGGVIATLIGSFFNYGNMVNLDMLLMVLTSYLIVNVVKMRYIALAAIIVTFADAIVCAFVMFFLHFEVASIETNRMLSLGVNAVMSLVLCLLLCVKRAIKPKQIGLELDMKSVCMLFVSAMAFGLYIVYVQWFGFGAGNDSQRRIAALGISVGGGVFFLAICFGVFFNVQNKKLKREVALKEKFLSQQKMYYIMLLEKEEKTKKFRHDIRGHISSIRMLIDEKDYENLGQYLEAMDEKLGELQVQTQTGNNVINAIIADMQNQYEDVSIQWTGMLKDELKIRSIDLCIIFSNLLSNAFRAANKSNEPVVYVDVKLLESNVMVAVRNMTQEEVRIEKKTIVKKVYQEGHGYGLKNVKDCIDSYNGLFEIQCREQQFIAEVLLPDIL